MNQRLRLLLLVLPAVGAAACDPTPTPTPTGTAAVSPTPSPTPPTPTPSPTPCGGASCLARVSINEITADNEGAWVDEAGQTDDLLELYNAGDAPVSLAGFAVGDDADEPHLLPNLLIGARSSLLLYADGEVEQGDHHLPFKLSADGEEVFLWGPDGGLLDQVQFPAAQPNDAWARFPDGVGGFGLCRFASPGRPNGADCGPPPPPSVPDDVDFAPFVWPEPWPAAPGPLALNELALRPAAFVELLNTADTTVSLAGWQVRVAPLVPGEPWPGPTDGVALALPTEVLRPGERLDVEADPADVAEVEAREGFEGVVTLFDPDTRVVDRQDFMWWPEGAALARVPDGVGVMRLCEGPSRGASNDTCVPVESRPIGTYLRRLHTPGDFAALGYGEPRLGVEGVKTVLDLDRGDQLFFLDSEAWDLHYTFVREVIEGQPHLDRCDPEDAALFNQGWYIYSVENYYTAEGRHYIDGTMYRYGGNDLHTVEYSTADVITPDQMKHGYFESMERLTEPQRWSVRAQDAGQIEKVSSIDGQMPAVGPNAPFEGQTFQPLNEGLAYGTLRFIPSTELAEATLGAQTIVVTDEVPLDIDLVAGLITEAFQTPLAHVAILSRNRGTPNMAQVDARSHSAIAPLLDTLVRFEVTSGGFTLSPATPEEALAFWESQHQELPLQVPAADLTVRGVQPLAEARYGDLPAIGAKAALFAELTWFASHPDSGDWPITVPRDAFALPVVHYQEHFTASGAEAYLTTQLEDPAFQADVAVRRERLLHLQELIRAHPVDAALLAEVESHVEDTFGDARVRFRSSSNTEDLKGFSGAGLYTSISGAVGDDALPIDDAIRTVWASLWNPRAFEERAYFNVDQTAVLMGILCHEAFLDEAANGVGISRNVLDPRRGSTYYLNVQRGEASVTNPAPGVVSDELLYRWGIVPPESYLAYSTFRLDGPVLNAAEVDDVARALKEIHEDFQTVLDPQREDAYFAMDIEFKLDDTPEGPRRLVVKQARPYNFGDSVVDPCE